MRGGRGCGGFTAGCLGIRPSQEDIDRFLPRRFICRIVWSRCIRRCSMPRSCLSPRSWARNRRRLTPLPILPGVWRAGPHDSAARPANGPSVLERAGHLTYREYSGMAHAICDEEIADIRDFLRTYDAGIASIWNISVQRGTFDLLRNDISVQRGTGPSRSGSTMAEWRWPRPFIARWFCDQLNSPAG